MQISGVSLALTWPWRRCLLRVFLWASATSFPLSKHWERSHCTHVLRPMCLFTVHVGSGSSLLSCGVFLPPPLSHTFPLLVAGRMPLLPPEPVRPAWLVLFRRKDSLPPIFGAQCTPPSFLCVFIVLIAYYSVSLFSPGGGSVCPGAMLLWPRLVCGSTMVPWSSPCPHLPKPFGRGQLAARGPSWFLCLTWSGDSLHQLEVWRG
jgi:hypothetical protein